MSKKENTLSMPLRLPAQAEGVVVAPLSENSVEVELQGRRWRTQRAASCLLTPEPGDRVLLANLNHQLWLLAVLERAQPEQTAQLGCGSDLHLTCGGALTLSSQQFSLKAAQGECDIDSLRYRGQSVSAWISVGRFFGKQCESVWESLSQFSQRLLRKTAQCEQVRAGQLDVKTEEFTRLHSRNTLISSTSLTKVDAKQIHMG